MTEPKEWVTVKLPKEVRDDARDDPRTYGQIMRAGLQATSHADGSVSVSNELNPPSATDPDAIADAVAARGLSLDAGEHRAIAEEVVGMLR